MSNAIPVWVWLPGATAPVQAAELAPQGDERYRFAYLPGYLGLQGPLALDPVRLRLKKTPLVGQLPGVIMDARPAGYGQDRLNAALNSKYNRALTDLELMEEGPGDTVGAIEACKGIDKKIRWKANPVEALRHEIEQLEAEAPASRAMRRANGDVGTSAGGERPKATMQANGRLWLVKMQDRGDRQGLPAMEHVAMTLAAKAGICVPPVQLISVGPHQAFMVERFDRHGNPDAPCRHLFASAHTVLQLPPDATRGDERRSYLFLADRMRVWCRAAPHLDAQLRELWCRMAFNALVGNTDDHPRNHGLLFKDEAWHLSPAFDITPIWRRPHERPDARPSLAMATLDDGGSGVAPARLIAASKHFGLQPQEAAAYLRETGAMVAHSWEHMLRAALAPIEHNRPAAYVDQVVDSARDAFEMSTAIASQPQLIERALEDVLAPAKRGRRGKRT
jgi:serine/threonine-protein kinase HipA